MNDTVITLIPVNIFNAEHQIYHNNQWVHSEGPVLHAYGIGGDKKTISETFTYPINGHTLSADNQGSHVFTVNTPEYGVIDLVVVKTGGCGCSDPRKPVTNIAQMRSLLDRQADRTARLTTANTAAEQRRAVARERAVSERGQRFAVAQAARAAAKAAQGQ